MLTFYADKYFDTPSFVESRIILPGGDTRNMRFTTWILSILMGLAWLLLVYTPDKKTLDEIVEKKNVLEKTATNCLGENRRQQRLLELLKQNDKGAWVSVARDRGYLNPGERRLPNEIGE